MLDEITIGGSDVEVDIRVEVGPTVVLEVRMFGEYSTHTDIAVLTDDEVSKLRSLLESLL